ncbi:TetR/AcrR family transcriptional regulator [Jiangella alba]|uniref:DNA-binding transcriptional regulator, AcrR family n=1 Tax=Jiangella alba TaxID=561176 RepID=A0A1H5M7L7_9ACTN|nr:TetR/AcrR family transcriptional regulator [Jiangella alba]SEE85275.1 DNA-binding transcriptional regulator, AcrR family [Jiangella alba]
MSRSPRSLLDVATEALLASPGASLTEVAAAAGVSRTTLHRHYPTRHALLLAVAEHSVTRVERAYAGAGLDAAGDDAAAALRRLLTALIPLGPQLEFIHRERSLDDDHGLHARFDALDDLVTGLVRRGQDAGVLRADLPAWWLVSSLNGAVYGAWELIDLGRLAPLDAPGLLLTTLLDGIGR